MKHKLELHLRRNDFRLEWFSGTGGGGQHRNKHQNCCRIIHIETGISAQSTRHKQRPANQRDAFNLLVARLISYYETPPERRTTDEVIRNYHAVRNEVRDKASGERALYKDVMQDIGPMIEARRKALSNA